MQKTNPKRSKSQSQDSRLCCHTAPLMLMPFCSHQSCSGLLSVSNRTQQPALVINISEVPQAVLHEDNTLILASSPSAPCCSVASRRCRKRGLYCVCKSNCADPLAPANVSFLRRGNRCNNGKRSWFFFKSRIRARVLRVNNHRAARGASRRLRASSVLPGDSEFTLERKLLKLLVYIYPTTHDRTQFKFWKPMRRSATVGGKVRLRLSAQTRWSLFSGWIKSFYSSGC